MGQIFSQLTQPGSALTDSSGNAAMVGDPSKIRDTLLKSSANFKPFANSPTDTGAPPTPGQSPLHNVGIGTPNLQQAASAGATPGGANALSPGLTKAGKLATLLTSGLQGALAGRARSEETVAATGGRRSGGAGMGFEAGYTLPWQRASQQNQLRQQQAQTELTESQSQMVPTQYGPLPAALARYILPAQIRGEATENAADTRAGATTQAAQIGAGSRVQGAQIGADARIKAAQMGLGPLADVSPELQQQLGLPAKLPLKMLNQAESAANKPLTVVAGENDSYVVNKRTNAKTPLGVGNRGAGAAQARPVVAAADPNDPGNLTYMPAGQAMKTGALAPAAAPAQTAKATARAVAPGGKVGEEINAFSTAIQHADLLRSAVAALGNGDQQTLNSLKNRFKTEFGVAGPITAQAIADAYQREVTSGLSKGHMTDSEIGSVGKTLNVGAQSPQQSLGVIDAYKALFQSKMNVRKQGVEQGMKGKANFPTTAPSGATHIVPGRDGKNHYTNEQGTVDLGIAP